MTHSENLTILPTEFNFEDHKIRIVIHNGEYWFVAADICAALNLSNPTKSVSCLDDDEKALTSIQGLSRGNEHANIVSESGLYTLILRCRDAVKQGTLSWRFRKWVTNEVLPSIRKTGKYEHPKHHPEARELLTADDTSHLSRLIWTMANGFRFERSWTQGIWYALRHATGVESPQNFEVNQIPIIAKECEKIYNFTNGVKEAIYEAEKQAVRRVLRKREDADKVLAEMKQLLEESYQAQTLVLADTLTRWQQAEIQQFLQRC
ncbi:MAG TPA: Bro-N domain-containing protein [Arsenophonus nasoniae]|uniref:BRO-N domain-containing protein n=1 Tax=Arsenophonus nasoniae TaxID=638 RepID=UPI0038790AB5